MTDRQPGKTKAGWAAADVRSVASRINAGLALTPELKAAIAALNTAAARSARKERGDECWEHDQYQEGK